jgi:hypothetical protein
MPIVIEQDDDEILVSEPTFEMHTGGATEARRMDAFSQVSGHSTCLNGQEAALLFADTAMHTHRGHRLYLTMANANPSRI